MMHLAAPVARPAARPDATGELAFRAAVFAWCVRQARRRRDRSALDAALRWLEVAGLRAANHPFGALTSPRLEAELLMIAGQLPLPTSPKAGEPAPSGARTTSGRSRWLHVLTEVYDIGGHTAMAARWCALDRERAHSAVLLSQRGPVPAFFRAAVEKSGGRLRQFDLAVPLLERAAQLRALAWAEADVVVLHTHPWDVGPAVAFGVAGGPPVLLLNHADHEFWAGGAAVDLVLDLRRAGQEWTQRHRGIPRTTLLPILVPDPEWAPADREHAAQRRAAAKAQLGLPANSLVLLTVAHGAKYNALLGRGLDFLEAAHAILKAHPRAWLLAVGPHSDARWAALGQATGGRVRAEGPQRDLRRYHAATDVYLESFPFGSATALLEAAIHEIPCVRTPRSQLPPLGTGGPGIEVLAQPEDAATYAREALALLESETARHDLGRALAAAVEACHGTAGWLASLGEVAARIPASHTVHPLPVGEPLPHTAASRWAEWSATVRPGNALVAAFDAALARALEPNVDWPLLAATTRRDRWRAVDDGRLAAACWAGLALRLPRPRYVTPDDVYRWTRDFLRPDRWLHRTVRRLARPLRARVRSRGSG